MGFAWVHMVSELARAHKLMISNVTKNGADLLSNLWILHNPISITGNVFPLRF